MRFVIFLEQIQNCQKKRFRAELKSVGDESGSAAWAKFARSQGRLVYLLTRFNTMYAVLPPFGEANSFGRSPPGSARQIFKVSPVNS